MLYKNHKPTAENITLLYTCACLTWLESTLLESMETAVDEDSLSTAQKKKKAIEIDHGPVQRSFGFRISDRIECLLDPLAEDLDEGYLNEGCKPECVGWWMSGWQPE